MLLPHVPALVERGLALLLDDGSSGATASAGLEVPSVGGAAVAVSGGDEYGAGASGVSSSSGSGGIMTSGRVSRLPDLRRLYSLLDRVNSLELLKQAWGAYIR